MVQKKDGSLSFAQSNSATKTKPGFTAVGEAVSRRRRLAQAWNLVLCLVRRDIKARYRRALLGPLWATLQPLILMVVFTAIQRVISIPSDGTPYAVFVYSALVPFQFLSNGVYRAGNSVYSNGLILKKISLPREVFPVSGVVMAFFDLVMSAVVLAAMMAYYHVPIGVSFLWVPVMLAILSLLTLGTGMMVAALGTYRSDLLIATPFLTQVWMYASPVIYPLSSVPERYMPIYRLNPLVGLIEGFRKVLTQGAAPPLDLLAWSAATTVAVVIVGWLVFRWLAQYFADVL